MGRPKGSKNQKTKAKAKPKAAPADKPMQSKAQQIGVDDLKNLLRRCKSWKTQGSEITGQIGEAIAKATKTKNLDKSAFAFVRKLAGMTEQKRLTTIACLDYYIDVLELDKGEQAEADLGRPEAGQAAEKKDEPARLRVVESEKTELAEVG